MSERRLWLVQLSASVKVLAQLVLLSATPAFDLQRPHRY
jgi:hypothetical protein